VIIDTSVKNAKIPVIAHFAFEFHRVYRHIRYNPTGKKRMSSRMAPAFVLYHFCCGGGGGTCEPYGE
jgi:hypothetical protein